MFTVLEAFGSVTTGHSSSSTRFSMVLSLDFSATGQITAAHLQVPVGPVTWGDGRAVAEAGGPRDGGELPLCCAFQLDWEQEEQCFALLLLPDQRCPKRQLSRSSAGSMVGSRHPLPWQAQNSAGMKSL